MAAAGRACDDPPVLALQAETHTDQDRCRGGLPLHTTYIQLMHTLYTTYGQLAWLT